MGNHLSTTAAGAGVPSRARGVALRITGWLLQVLATGLIVAAAVEVLGGRLFVVPEAGVWPLSVMPDVDTRNVLGGWLFCAVAAIAFFCGVRLDTRGRRCLPAAADRRRPRVVAWAVSFAGCLLTLASILPSITLFKLVMLGGGVAAGTPLAQRVLLCAVVLVGGIPPLEYARRILRSGRRRMAPVLRSPADLGDRSYVLYLRPFSVDEKGYVMPSLFEHGFPLSRFLLPESFIGSTLTHEQVIVGKFVQVGKVVAVGRPGEKLPFPGATRFYLPLEGWQPVVSDLIRRARLVLLVAGTSPGTLWEFTEAVRLLPPPRLVLLVQDGSDEYDRFRQAARAAFAERAEELHRAGGDTPEPPALPDYPPLSRPDQVERLPLLRGVVRFDAEWTPTFERLDPTVVSAGWKVPEFQFYSIVKRIEAQLSETSASGRGRNRRPVLGWAVHGVTVLLALAGAGIVALTVVFDAAGDTPVSGRLIGSFLVVWSLLLGASVTRFMHRWAQSHTARLLRSAAEIGPDPCVLFLCPAPGDIPLFVDSPDLQGAADVTTAWLQFGVEEEMGRIFAPYGKLIAVGSPGETLGWPGVTRLYLPPEDWSTPLAKAMMRSRLVVMTVGTAPQTLWALTEAVRLLFPSQLLLLVPAEPGAYNAFRRAALEALDDRLDELKRSHGPSFCPPSLPAYPSEHRRVAPGTVHDGSWLRGAVFFRAGWHPVFVQLDDPQQGPWTGRHERCQAIQAQLKPHLMREN